jgi:hypothetical protein
MGSSLDRGIDSIGRFGEEERRLPIRVGAHFPRVFRIVASDAEDATNGKPIVTPGDRNTRLRGSVDNEAVVLCHLRPFVMIVHHEYKASMQSTSVVRDPGLRCNPGSLW